MSLNQSRDVTGKFKFTPFLKIPRFLSEFPDQNNTPKSTPSMSTYAEAVLYNFLGPFCLWQYFDPRLALHLSAKYSLKRVERWSKCLKLIRNTLGGTSKGLTVFYWSPDWQSTTREKNALWSYMCCTAVFNTLIQVGILQISWWSHWVWLFKV